MLVAAARAFREEAELSERPPEVVPDVSRERVLLDGRPVGECRLGEPPRPAPRETELEPGARPLRRRRERERARRPGRGPRVTRLLVAPLLESLRQILGPLPLLSYLACFRYALAGEFAMRADLARVNRVPSNWGLEIGVLAEVYRMLCIHLGEPPSEFEWQWRDKDKEFHRDGVMTPTQFREKYVPIDLDGMICLIHCPQAGKALLSEITRQGATNKAACAGNE